MAQYKYKVKKGFKWMVKFRYIDPTTGKTNIHYKRAFETKRDAKEYEETFLEKIDKSSDTEEIFPEDFIPTFYDVYNEYLSSHKHEDIKESTLGTKKNIFEHHIFPYFKDKLINEITSDDIATWQNEERNIVMPSGKKFSLSYLRTIQCQFNSIINYAQNKGYLSKNPLADIKNMGIKDKRIEFWTTDEYERFAEYAMEMPEYYYAFEVLYWCGLREGEMLALTSNDIDLKNNTISVTKTYLRLNGKDTISTPKTPSSVRTVSMPSFLSNELKEYMDMLYGLQSNERLFVMHKSNLLRQFHRISEEAGVKKITIHGLRHSHVSLLISKKYDIFEISKRIGHKSIKTTQDTYGHLFDTVQKTIANDLDNMRRR